MPNSQTVKEALEKKAAFGKDLDLEHYASPSRAASHP